MWNSNQLNNIMDDLKFYRHNVELKEKVKLKIYKKYT